MRAFKTKDRRRRMGWALLLCVATCTKTVAFQPSSIGVRTSSFTPAHQHNGQSTRKPRILPNTSYKMSNSRGDGGGDEENKSKSDLMPDEEIEDAFAKRVKVDGEVIVLESPAAYSSRVSSKFRSTSYDLVQASIVGVITGLSVALFKLSIEAIREFCYDQAFLSQTRFALATIPAFGGLMVGILLLLGSFPAGLRGTVMEVDKDSVSPAKELIAQVKGQLSFIRKSVAAVFTLGTGCSLGPEGPCVEIGMSVARSCIDLKPRIVSRRTTWNRLLLSCGAAAGVAAGFNAPIAGVFFALEIMQNAFYSVQEENRSKGLPLENGSYEAGTLLSTTATITPVLLASVLSALVAKVLLGNHLVLVLTEYSLKTPLVELPLYLLLGGVSGCVAFIFSRLAKLSQSFFDGKLGADGVRHAIQRVPSSFKPVIGGLACGIVGLWFPQILFFGYETLNSLLSNNSLPTSLALSLLIVKMLTTAFSAGSGLVGGTFAPSLFLGAMTGAAFHNVACVILNIFSAYAGVTTIFDLADVPAYAMVGAASVLAALFRAPLTASLLLFELTRDYDVILPLMASAGIGSVIGDMLDSKFERVQERRRRDQDSVSWGDLADRGDS